MFGFAFFWKYVFFNIFRVRPHEQSCLTVNIFFLNFHQIAPKDYAADFFYDFFTVDQRNIDFFRK